MQRVAINVPQDWVHVDLSPQGDVRFGRALERLRAAGARFDQADAAQVRQAMRGVRAAAREENAVIAAVWARPHAEHVTLAASLVVTVRPYWRPPDHADDEATDDPLDPIFTSFQETPDITEIERVELPAGPAVRVVRQVAGLTGKDRAGAVAVQYYIPVTGGRPADASEPSDETSPPTPPAVVIAAFTTPVTALVDRFVRLFDRLAATVRVDASAERSAREPDRQ